MSAGPLSNVTCTVWLAVDSAESRLKRGGLQPCCAVHQCLSGFLVDRASSRGGSANRVRLLTQTELGAHRA